MEEAPRADGRDVIGGGRGEAVVRRFIERFSNATVVAFGLVMTGFALLVAFETVSRKFLNVSLQGVDELGGYVLAVTSSLAFTLALVDRAHIRIDLFHLKLPRGLRAALNWLSAAMVAAFAGLLVYVGLIVVRETIDFGSTAPTPWATPLIWPQSLWLAALMIFLLFALGSFVAATRLLVTGRIRELDRKLGPKGAEEEIEEELADLRRR
jgi:TRAP-type C4-dicarboxylate transport system permease small subunit